MEADPAACLGRERIEAPEDVPHLVVMSRPGDETSMLPHSWRVCPHYLEAAIYAVVEDNAKLRAAVAKVPKKCPIFGHTDSTRRRRVDCADDQCRNPECVRYVECEHWSHDLGAALTSPEYEGSDDCAES
ncbi:MAG: hypothetical protein ACYCTE_09490 [Acidimicrobiales bacterium]